MKERVFESGNYRYGFNSQEKDDEVAGSGNVNTAEYWEYDTRLGRRWNLDPMESKYPYFAPYLCLDDNPISLNDPKGLETSSQNGDGPKKNNPEHKSRIERKKDRKYDHWIKKNRNSLKEISRLDRWELFRLEHWDVRWFKKWEKSSLTKSATTGIVTTQSHLENIVFQSPGSGFGVGTFVIPVIPGSMLRLDYNMLAIADKIEVTDANTTVLFSSNTVPGSDAMGGKVLKRNGSGVTFIPLTNTITVTINGSTGGPSGSRFHFRVVDTTNSNPNGQFNNQRTGPANKPKR